MKTMNLCGLAAALIVLPACVQQHTTTVVVPPPAAVMAAPVAPAPASAPQKKKSAQPAAKPATQPAAKPAPVTKVPLTLAAPEPTKADLPAVKVAEPLPPLRGTHSQVISPGDGVKAKRSMGGEKTYAH